MPTKLVETKHYSIALQLRGRIQRMEPGDVLPRISDLIAEFKTSQSTLDRALARLRSEGLIHRPPGKQRLVVAEACDPALRRIVIVRPDFPSEVFEAITQVVVEAGRQKDWAFDYTYYRSMDKLDLGRAMGDNDGAILQLTGEKMPRRLRTAIRSQRQPIVIAQTRDDALEVATVCSDDARMAEMAVDHFHTLGHREMAILVPLTSDWAMQQAVSGWQRGVQHHHVGVTVLDAQTKPFERQLETSYRRVKAWLATAPPATALYAATTQVGMGALRALREAHMDVPGQMSLIVSSGMAQMGDYLFPPVTTLEYDSIQYGKEIVQSLERGFTQPGQPPKHTTIEPYLILRESTLALPLSSI